MTTDTAERMLAGPPHPGPPAPYNWLAIDVETYGGRPEHAERWMRIHWSPPSNVKSPAVIGQRWLDALEAKKQKLALLDGAQIICIALRGEARSATGAPSITSGCLNCMTEHDPRDVGGATVQGFASHAEMLTALGAFLRLRTGPDTMLVGHNIRGFDLPMLRHAFVRERVPMPGVLAARDLVLFDNMVEYDRRFSLVSKPFVALADLLELFELESHKGIVSGAQVGELYEAGQYDVIIKYNLLDVIAESNLFLRMTGQLDEPTPSASDNGPGADQTSAG